MRRIVSVHYSSWVTLLTTWLCWWISLPGLADLEPGLRSPPLRPRPSPPHRGLFPLGNWSCSINSLCLSEGRLSQRNRSNNFLLWDWESSRDLRDPAPDLFMKAGSMAWNSNRARDPITWLGGKNCDKDVKLYWVLLEISILVLRGELKASRILKCEAFKFM